MHLATPPFQPQRAFNQAQLSALDKQLAGCIQLDKTGRVQEMNVAASAVLCVRATDAQGKFFFTDVAPCANTPEFYGRFKTAMECSGVLNEVIDHRFLLVSVAGGASAIDLRVHMFSSIDAAGLPVVWIVTRKKANALADSSASPLARLAAACDPQAAQPVSPTPRLPIQGVSSQFDELI